MSGFAHFKLFGLGIKTENISLFSGICAAVAIALPGTFSRRVLLVSLLPAGDILLFSQMKTKLPFPTTVPIVTAVATISTYHLLGSMKVFLESKYSLHGGTFHISNRWFIHQHIFQYLHMIFLILTFKGTGLGSTEVPKFIYFFFIFIFFLAVPQGIWYPGSPVRSES